MIKRIYQVHVRGYVLMEAESAEEAEEKVADLAPSLADFDREAADDVTDAPHFKRRIERGEYDR